TVADFPICGSNYVGGGKENRYIDTENLNTVEVVQGTSYIISASLEALGGTFNFVSKAPSLDSSTTFAYTAGSHDETRYYVKHET
ncbi:TonB-dependent receptor, partial [Pseudoalteromonas sp. S1691]